MTGCLPQAAHRSETISLPVWYASHDGPTNHVTIIMASVVWSHKGGSVAEQVIDVAACRAFVGASRVAHLWCRRRKLAR